MDNENIFKSKIDLECKNIAKKSTQMIIIKKDIENNICKHFVSDEVLNWELKVYQTLKKYNITPKLDITKSIGLQVTYNTNHLTSLRNYIKKQKINYSLFFNELFSFINSFKTFKFVHGNLHIDNVFVSQCKYSGIKYYIIDYSNAFLFNTKIAPKYKRSSYIGEYNYKILTYNLIYWDFFTMYISLHEVIGNNDLIKDILVNVVRTYVKTEKLLELIVKRY
jgi:hypothetical protein